MSYANTTEVLRYTGRGEKFGSPNFPLTADDVRGLIEDVAAEIDGVLSQLGVTLPVSSSAAPRTYAFLKRLNCLGAAAQIELRLFGESSAASVRQSRWNALLEQYQTALGKLYQERTGLVWAEIEGAVRDSDLVFTGNYKDPVTGEVKEPFFKRGDVY